MAKQLLNSSQSKAFCLNPKCVLRSKSLSFGRGDHRPDSCHCFPKRRAIDFFPYLRDGICYIFHLYTKVSHPFGFKLCLGLTTLDSNWWASSIYLNYTELPSESYSTAQVINTSINIHITQIWHGAVGRNVCTHMLFLQSQFKMALFW